MCTQHPTKAFLSPIPHATLAESLVSACSTVHVTSSRYIKLFPRGWPAFSLWLLSQIVLWLKQTCRQHAQDSLH